jgi:cyclohexanone monooxygenase
MPIGDAARHGAAGADVPAAVRERYQVEREKRLRAGQQPALRLTGAAARYRADPFTTFTPRAAIIDDDVDAVVVGAGLGGLVTAARLREAGLQRIRLVEFAGDVGGVWYWNRYPGVRCDVESYIYMPLLEELGYLPSEKYARGAEILDHARGVAKHYGLYGDALFHTTVTGMDWLAASDRWQVRTDRGDRLAARYAVLALGTLTEPRLPDVPGLTRFRGPVFHTSRWDYSVTGGDADGNLTGLRDKRVAVVGTAASAVQCVPPLARWAEHLYVVQRTPCTIMPRDNRPTDPAWGRALEPGWQRRRMENFSSIVEGAGAEVDLVEDGWTQALGDLLRAPADPRLSAEERAAAYERADLARMEDIRQRVATVVRDEETAERLKPYYAYLCKRPCFHDEYLPAFNQPNVTLLDTEGRGIDQIDEDGIVVAGTHRDVDVLIFATGFDLGENSALQKLRFPILGRDRISLVEKWRDGIATLHGLMSSGFPNLFFHPTLNSQSTGSSNWTHMIYVTAEHIAAVVDQVRRRGHHVFDVSVEAEREWGATVLAKRIDNRAFLEACTPGRANNEGRPDLRPPENSNYGPGLFGLVDLLAAWERDGLPGLHTR